jgi:hypothetical protein
MNYLNAGIGRLPDPSWAATRQVDWLYVVDKRRLVKTRRILGY